mmetsp:Transcript_83139/g.211638  ORF Transcript_83139/g.211638 Transcript_83139/m.211638 type:complete len:221 (+) Transcript_83139:26-688(+)
MPDNTGKGSRGASASHFLPPFLVLRVFPFFFTNQRASLPFSSSLSSLTPPPSSSLSASESSSMPSAASSCSCCWVAFRTPFWNCPVVIFPFRSFFASRSSAASNSHSSFRPLRPACRFCVLVLCLSSLASAFSFAFASFFAFFASSHSWSCSSRFRFNDTCRCTSCFLSLNGTLSGCMALCSKPLIFLPNISFIRGMRNMQKVVAKPPMSKALNGNKYGN